MDDLQDEVDFTLAKYAIDHGIPTLAVCRGLHVVNAVLGGTLVVDMPVHHRHHVHAVALDDPDEVLGVGRADITSSCYHHQAIDSLAPGITVLGRSTDGIVEAVAIESGAWAAGVQRHPEDTYDVDDQQLALVRRLVDEASG